MPREITKKHLATRATAICIGAAVAIISTALMLGANFAATDVDRVPIRANIADAFAKGDLSEATHLPTDTQSGAHQYNDCLILLMVINENAPKIERALSPLGAIESASPCRQLKIAITQDAEAGLSDYTPYHRYLHGHTAFAAFIVGAAPLRLIRTVFSFSIFSLAAGLVAVSILRAVSLAKFLSNAADESKLISRFDRAIYIGGAGLVILLFFGLQFFGMSLSHFPADMLLLLYLGAWLTADINGWNTAYQCVFHSIFGATTAYFEFLTGGIPLSLCFIFYGYAAAARTQNEPVLIANALTAAAAFVVGVGAAFVMKLAATNYVFDVNVFADFIGRLSYRTHGNGPTNPFDLVQALLSGSLYIGAGSRPLGMALILLPAIFFVLFLYRILSAAPTQKASPRAILLIFSALSIYGWWFVFAQHTAQHNFFMVRIGVGAIIAVAALGATIHSAALRSSLANIQRAFSYP